MSNNQPTTQALAFIRDNHLTTPVSFYSETYLLEAYALMRSAVGANTRIYYAIKSCYHPPILQALSRLGLGAEVMSELEYDLARTYGFRDVILNGLGRSSTFLRKAAADGACIILDSLADLDTLRAVAHQTDDRLLRVGVRLALQSNGYPDNRYFTEPHKLGNRSDSKFYKDFLDFCKTTPNIIWHTLHAHFAINELSPDVYFDITAQLRAEVERLSANNDPLPCQIDLGGGFEVYTPELRPKFASLFSGVVQEFNRIFDGYSLALEPGRYLSAYSGFAIGTVLDVKPVANKHWIITDIGTNVLIPIPNARYRLIIPQPSAAGLRVGLTDGITSPANNLIVEVCVKKLPEIGDTVVVGNTGAYTDVYSAFWCYPPQKVCFLPAEGQPYLYRSQQDIDQIANILFKMNSSGN